ncbi:peptidase M22 [Oleiharenicola lentus]|uniref:peptidase M22 n=1 Tax=Oleiharenicola lentus TaxID=2508720 RepID=UPI003F680ACA
MPSLPQLLASHGNLLVLDAASTRIQVGLLRLQAPAIWREAVEEAGSGLFSLTQAALQEANLRIAEVGSFVFCEGPGSMLGIRTVAAALRTWQALAPRPCFSYQSLAVAGHYAWAKSDARPLTLIADARRDTWHVQIISVDGKLAPLARVAATELAQGEIFTPDNFRVWTKLPESVQTCSYRLEEILPTLVDGDYFRPTENPDAFQHEAPEYKKWSAQVHSAATAPQK